MKNSLMTVICLLIVLLIVLLMVKGLSIGNFKILSISQIIQSGEQLDEDIANVNSLKNSVYRQKLTNLETATKTLSSSKQQYLDIANVSTDAEIRAATQNQTYTMEYLWSKLGGYATQEGVNTKLEVKATSEENENTLNFTVTGSYVGIINYITAIEDDSDLSFRIENFKISSENSEEVLTATFTVSNINIKQETVTTQVPVEEKTEEESDTNNTEDTAKSESEENTNNVNS